MTARADLQAATREIHEALHAAAPFAAIADGSIDRAGYAALLLRLHAYHSAMLGPCAAGARVLEAPALTVAQSTRIAALEADLEFLGTHAAHVAPDAAHDAAFAVGALYTVFGSVLGGKVIFRQLATLLPDANGRSFFAGTPGDGALWRLYCEKLEDFAATGDMAAVIAGARHAFARFEVLVAAAPALAAE